jgi:hypothetical protein
VGRTLLSAAFEFAFDFALASTFAYYLKALAACRASVHARAYIKAPSAYYGRC